jgi:hypothetical protein
LVYFQRDNTTIVDSEPMRNSLLRHGSWVADHGINGLGPFRAARDLLLRQPPRASLDNVETLIDERQHVTDAARQFVLSLSSQVSVLPIQGPPGSGKTYTGARMVVELVRLGKRIGSFAPANAYKVFVIAAGALEMPVRTFVLGLLVARGFRFFGEGFLAVRLGDQASHFLPTHKLEVTGIALSVVLVLYLLSRIAFRTRSVT